MVLTGTRLRHGTWDECTFLASDMREVDLVAASLVHCDLSQAQLDAVLGPDRFTYRLDDGFGEGDAVSVEIRVPNDYAPDIDITVAKE